MKVLALDIATKTGVCVGDSGADPLSWSVDLGKSLSEDQRFSNVLILTHNLIEKHKPDMIVVEAFIGGKHASAFLIGLVACVRGVAANRGVKVVMVYPATVRKHFMGKALTSRDFPGLKQAKAKIAIKESVAAQCRAIGWDITDLDAADAAATWDWACANHVPKYQAKTGGLFAKGGS